MCLLPFCHSLVSPEKEDKNSDYVLHFIFLARCGGTCIDTLWYWSVGLYECKIKTNSNMEYVCSNVVPPFALLHATRVSHMSLVKVVCLHCAELAAKNNCQLKPTFANRDMCDSNTSQWWKKPRSNSASLLLLETRKTQNNLRTPMPRCNLIIYGSVVSFLV